jgi:hypothetical protein
MISFGEIKTEIQEKEIFPIKWLLMRGKFFVSAKK